MAALDVPEAVELDEVGSKPADLTREEAREIDLGFGSDPVRLGVHGDPRSGRWVLDGKGYAGAITLSTGRSIRVATKVPVASIFYLLRYARSGYEFFDPTSTYAKSDDFFEVVVQEFTRRTAELVRLGLHQGYVDEEQERLTAVRGRLLVATQLRRNFVTRDRFACRFAEFTPDLPMNQALKLATFLASRLLYRRARTRDELEANLRLFGGVSLVSMDPEVPLRIVLDRLTEGYRIPLALASLIIASVSLEDEVGGTRFASYLVDMKTLFQQYVAAVLREALRGTGVTVLAQQRRALDDEGRFEYVPDIELWRDGECLVLLDTKYKRYEPRVGGIGGPSNTDMNQVYVYRDALGARKVVLLYPVVARDTIRAYAGRLDIGVRGLDLAGSPDELEERARVFAHELLAELPRARAA